MSDPGPGTPRRTGPTWAGGPRCCWWSGSSSRCSSPLYAKETPALFGFPFFYWFQFLMIPIVSALTYTAFRLSLRATEKDRRVFGLPADRVRRTAGRTTDG